MRRRTDPRPVMAEPRHVPLRCHLRVERIRCHLLEVPVQHLDLELRTHLGIPRHLQANGAAVRVPVLEGSCERSALPTFYPSWPSGDQRNQRILSRTRQGDRAPGGLSGALRLSDRGAPARLLGSKVQSLLR